MSERDYLANYDPAAFTPLAVAVDVVVLTAFERSLHVFLVERGEHPARGKLALPGAFVRADEDLDAAAARALAEKLGVIAPVRQFHTFGAVERDPRMRIVSVGYMALIPYERLADQPSDRFQMLRLDGDAVRAPNGRKIALPFDHADIIAAALRDLRANLDHNSWAFGLLPPEFSLRELQEVHEAIRGRAVNKPAFRKRLLDSGWLEGTGRRETDKGFRPAELYRVSEGRDERRD